MKKTEKFTSKSIGSLHSPQSHPTVALKIQLHLNYKINTLSSMNQGMSVHPRQGGGIAVCDITELDILCGRGTKYCHHRGNKRYHLLVQVHCGAYRQAQSKDDKTKISRSIVESLRNSSPPARFIAKKDSTKDGAETWYEIGNKRAWEKTSQLLREMVSKGNHKTVYQKRKWDKELRRKSKKQPKSRESDLISPPPKFRQQYSPSPLLSSSVSSAGSVASSISGLGSTNSSFSTMQGSPSSLVNAHLRAEVFVPNPSQDTIDPLPLAHRLTESVQSFAQQNSNFNVCALKPPNATEKYGGYGGMSSFMPVPTRNQNVPTLGTALSNMQAQLSYLLDSVNGQTTYMNPYLNNSNLPFSSIQRRDGLPYAGHLATASHAYVQTNGGSDQIVSQFHRSMHYPGL